MSRLLLDTSAYAAFFRDHPGVKAAVQEASELFLSPIVLGELRSGFLKGARREENEKELREFLASSALQRPRDRRRNLPPLRGDPRLPPAEGHARLPERPLDRRLGRSARPDGPDPGRGLRPDPAGPRAEVRTADVSLAEVTTPAGAVRPIIARAGEGIMALDRRSATVAAVVLAVVGWTVAAAVHAASGRPPASEAYVWKNVQMVGGGFVDGIIFHPTAKDVRYARTDIGGAYRWNAETQRWEPLLDWLSYQDLNLMGVESIAVDPSDPDRVYLACGTYINPATPNGAILRSTDRGQTWKRTNLPFKLGGNETGRGNGERLAVDPHDGRILLLGTRHARPVEKRGRGSDVERVRGFPDIDEVLPPKPPDEPPGCARPQRRRVRRLRSAQRASGQGQPTLYAGVSLMGSDNLFRSRDGGKTWKPVPGQPTRTARTTPCWPSDGNLYVTYGTVPGPWRMIDGAVWKLDTKSDAWTDITPEKPGGREGLRLRGSLRRRPHPQVLIASTLRPPAGQRRERDLPQHRRGQDLEAGVRRRRQARLRAGAVRGGDAASTGCSTSRSTRSTRTTRCSRPATAAGRPSTSATSTRAARPRGA